MQGLLMSSRAVRYGAARRGARVARRGTARNGEVGARRGAMCAYRRMRALAFWMQMLQVKPRRAGGGAGARGARRPG